MTLEDIADVLDLHKVKYKRKKNYITISAPIKCSIITDDAVKPNTFPVYIIRDSGVFNMVMDKILMSM